MQTGSKQRPNVSRFNDVVKDYENYRPSYPGELIEILEKQIGFSTTGIVADIGSGTGISSSVFVANKNVVYGVEPNEKMRAVAERKFKNDLNFRSIDGTAELTTLNEKTVHLIFCGQSFHWFDSEKSKKEFQRILKPNGHVVLAWNERDLSSQFHISYEKILRRNIEEYNKRPNRKCFEEKVSLFFENARPYQATISQSALYDLDSLKGRLRSSSFCPRVGMDVYKNLFDEIEDLFYSFEENGWISFDYKTRVFMGRI